MTNDILDRIDATIAAWEAAPESWVPGDPLYDEPRGATWDEQTVRPMIEEFPVVPPSRMRCEPCQVSWAGIAACFVCGEDRPPLPGGSSVYELLMRMGRIPRPALPVLPVLPVQAVLTVDTSHFQRTMAAMAAMAEHVNRAYDVAIEDLFKRLMPPRPLVPPRLTGPPPLAIDGAAYHHRTRARARRTRRNR